MFSQILVDERRIGGLIEMLQQAHGSMLFFPGRLCLGILKVAR
jgi:hypothetical protein